MNRANTIHEYCEVQVFVIRFRWASAVSAHCSSRRESFLRFIRYACENIQKSAEVFLSGNVRRRMKRETEMEWEREKERGKEKYEGESTALKSSYTRSRSATGRGAAAATKAWNFLLTQQMQQGKLGLLAQFHEIERSATVSLIAHCKRLSWSSKDFVRLMKGKPDMQTIAFPLSNFIPP